MAKFDENTTLGEILEDKAASAILTKYLGEAVLNHPLLPLVKMFTVKTALKYKEQTGFAKEDIVKMIDEILSLGTTS